MHMRKHACLHVRASCCACILEIKREVLHADRSFVEDLGFQGPHESTTSAHQFATMK